MSNTIRTLLLCAAFLACSGSERPSPSAQNNVAASSETIRRVIEDTVRVVHYDTLRTVALDTIRVVHYDTVHTEHKFTIYDTVRVVSISSIENERRPTAPLLSQDEFEQIQSGLSSGMMSAKAMKLITHDVPAFTTVPVGTLDSLQQELLVSTFGVAPGEIEQFRWGLYATPTGSPLAEHRFLTVWRRKEGSVDQLVVTVAPSGKLANKTDAEMNE